MAKKESVLKSLQLEHLEIEHFIFHIINPDLPLEDRVFFLDEVGLTEEQKDFFTQRLKDASTGTQCVFNLESVNLKNKCSAILDDPDGQFISLSRQIARDFADKHGRNTASGVLVVAVAKTLYAENDPVRFVFLVKLDHKDVYRYTLEEQAGGHRAIMEKVANNLVEDKAAIQKSALIDPTERFAWDVLAAERRPPPTGYIWAYFQEFLGVQIREDSSELTRRAFSTVSRWASTLPREEIPEDEDANTYRARAIQYLNDHATFNTDTFIDTVVKDANQERRELIMQRLRDALAESGVAGQTFQPKPGSLPKARTRHTYITDEGVTIQFHGSLDDVRMHIKRRGPDQNYDELTIRTERLNTKVSH